MARFKNPLSKSGNRLYIFDWFSSLKLHVLVNKKVFKQSLFMGSVLQQLVQNLIQYIITQTSTSLIFLFYRGYSGLCDTKSLDNNKCELYNKKELWK